MARPTTDAILTLPVLAAAGLPHGFTTVAAGDLSDTALATPEGQRSLAGVGRRLGFESDQVVTAEQVHGSTVAVVHLCDNCGPGHRIPHTDGLISEEPWPLMIRVADCFPVIVYEPRAKVVALVHCGWRGTLAGVLPRAVGRLLQESGGRVSEMRAGIGPGICGDCYEVGQEVAHAAWSAGLGAHLSADADGAHYQFDIGAAVNQQLLDCGLREANVERLWRCTFEDPELPSFRRDRTGFRVAAIAVLDKPPQSDLRHHH